MGNRPYTLFILTSFLLAGCSALVTPSQPESALGIEVTITSKSQSITTDTPITITVQVSNDGKHKGVEWFLFTTSGQPCSPACGTIVPVSSPSFSAIYTPPASLPPGTSIQVVVYARSITDRGKKDQIILTVTAPAVSLSISGEFPSVTTAGPANTLSAITNDAVGVTWTLTAGGAACSPYCGNLDFSNGQHLAAIYTPPPILAAGTSPSATITAISNTNPAQTASFTFTINAAAASNYSFLLRGYDSSGTALAIAGVLVADGNGTITNGELDINDGTTVSRLQAIQGMFGTDTDFAGIIRGTITLTNVVFPGTAVHPVFKFVIRGTEVEARLIEFDATGNLVAGTLLIQTELASQAPTGAFAFGLDSDAPTGTRTVEAGAFDLSPGGALTGIADQSQAQAAVALQSQNLSGNVDPPDALGRGTMAITLYGTSTQFAYYQVSQSRFFLVQVGGGSSPNTVLAGSAMGHALAFDSANGVFATSVFQLTGAEQIPNSNATAPDAAIGLLKVANDGSLSVSCDANNAGVVSTGSSLVGTLSSYDPNTGRAVYSISGGFQNGFVDTLVAYLYDNGEGFAIGIDPTVAGSTKGKAFSGTLSRQIPGPYSSQSINGPLVAVSGASSVPQIPAVTAGLSADGSTGATTGLAYADSVQGPLPNVTFGATFAVTDANAGHGTAMFPAGFYGDFTPQAVDPATFYLIGPNRLVSIGAKNGTPSGVTYISPD